MRSNMGEEQARSRRNLFILIVLCVYLLLSLFMFDPKPFTGGDNAVYVLLAESIAQGKGYKDLYLPDEQPHSQYPFGFPLLLTPFVLIFGINIPLLKFVVLLSGLGALYFMTKICETLFKGKIYFLIALYTSIPIMITFNHWILTEMPFICLSLASIYLLIKAETGKQYFYYLAFLCSIYAVFIRTAGIALIVGIIVWLLLHKRYKQMVIIIILFLLVFIPWQMRNAGIERGGGYVEQLLARNPYQMELGRINILDFMRRIADNFLYYAFRVLPSILLPVLQSEVLLTIVGAILTILTFIGFITRINRRSVFETYFAFAIMVLLAWPYVWASDRFLLPVLPIFVIYIYSGVLWIRDKTNFRHLVPAFAGVIIALNIIVIVPLVRQTLEYNAAYLKGDRYAGYGLDWRRYFEIVEWTRKYIPYGNVIMARKPEFVYLLSRHKSIIYPFTTDHAPIRDAIEKCDYIILDNFFWTATSAFYLFPVIEETPEKYTILKKTGSPEFYLLKIESDS